ncbi:hypothetical protein [Actinomadura atramentaria]|uniref:hypothetical protein n=1 Tax=Actinomadura atramentaria TaxID=1990 RepID=UPI00037BB9F4|nr:hypothetical protein [Actinomadura atramentaria]
MTVLPTDPTPVLPAAPPAEHTGSGIGFWLLLALLGLIWLIAWRVSLRRHPFRSCAACGGSGKHRSSWFAGAFRACDRCGGSGRQQRPGAREPFVQNTHKQRRQR